jgi:enoyl-CoA hydratase/carnithine racemase
LVVSRLDENTGVGFIRLNRAAKKNALSAALLTELTEHINTMSANDALRCIVLEAEGDTFSAGRDLHDMRERDRRRVRFGDDSGMTMAVVRALRSAPQITIASVQGHCLGGGFVLMSACDLAVIADDAKVGMPEILRGSYGRSATPMLFHSRIPLKHAFLVQLTGRNISGAEAARMGLASLSVPGAELQARTYALAAEIASRNPVALEHAKVAAYTLVDLPFDAAAKVDETISHRMRRFTDPLADVEGYLKSQKGGTNLGYKRPDGE